jgi:HK97 family phage major capsid protein
MRQGIEVASSEHILFSADQVMVRAIARVGGALPRPTAFAVLKTAAS